MSGGEDPRCPVCGRAADTFYMTGGRIVGCELCVRPVEWYAVPALPEDL